MKSSMPASRRGAGHRSLRVWNATQRTGSAIGIAIAILAVSGCTDSESPARDPSEFGLEETSFPDDLRTIEVTSAAFGEGEPIPDRYTCEGDDVSPPIAWSGLPDGTGSIALVCEDPDAPFGTFRHWVCFTRDPSHSSLEENAFEDSGNGDGWIIGENDFPTLGYRGPCPAEGPPHRYQFRVIAVEGPLNLSEGASIDDVLIEVEGRVLAWGTLTGMFGMDDPQ